MSIELVAELRAERDALQARATALATPQGRAAYVQERMALIDYHLARVPHRQPKRPGNVSMRQVLQQRRGEWAQEVRPGGLMDQERARLAAQIAALDEEIAAMEADNGH